MSRTKRKCLSFSSFAHCTNTQPWMPALCDVTEGNDTWQKLFQGGVVSTKKTLTET